MVNKLVLHEDYFNLPVIYKFKKGQAVYVDGDYFDIKNKPSWSKEVLKVNPRYVIFPGLIRETNILKKNVNYTKIRWFVDNQVTTVKTKDITLLPRNYNMIKGIIYKNSAMIDKFKENKKGKMTNREKRLLGNLIKI
jgi:hypothetical protein